MLRRLRNAFARDGQRETIRQLRERRIAGILTLTGNPAWDERLARTLVLPAGPHLLVVDAASVATSDGQWRLRLRAALLGEPLPKGGAPLALPAGGTLVLLAGEDEVHHWELTPLFARLDSGDTSAGEELLELELHVQEVAGAAAMAGYEPPAHLRFPDEPRSP